MTARPLWRGTGNGEEGVRQDVNAEIRASEVLRMSGGEGRVPRIGRSNEGEFA